MQPPTIQNSQRTVYGLRTRRQRFFRITCCNTFILTCTRTWLVFSCADTALAVPALVGDFDSDADLDGDNADLLTAENAAATHDFNFDVDGDSLVNLVDLDLWFPLYSTESGVPLATALVDIDFSMVNEVADFQIIQSNLSVATTNFTDGNLNADSVVDVADRNFYISRGGVVPEPATLTACASLGLVTHGHRCRGA